MRAIMVMFDSLRRDMLPPYGCKDVYAPSLERLAEKSVQFDCSYVGSMPCMPARRELHTGRLNFLHRSWGPLEPFDDSMPELLKRSGVHTHLVSDHYHYWEDGGATYHQRYSTWDIVRGQEADHWKPDVDPAAPPEHLGRYFSRDFVNRGYIDTEEKMPQHITFDRGLEFLEINQEKDNWFLQIETFDPHEPFFAAEKYRAQYADDYEGPHFDWPDYKIVDENQQAVSHLRNEYKALVSMCDYNLGRILDYMDAHDMWKDTLLIVNTDHGFMLSEHDWWGKCVMPFYDEVARTPLFVYDPRLKLQGKVCDALVQTIDLCPSILEFFGKPIPKDVQGHLLAPVMESGIATHQAVLFGQHGHQVNITDGRYVYMRASVTEDNGPCYQYTLMPTHSGSFFSLEEVRSATLAQPFAFTKGCPTLKTDAQKRNPNSNILKYDSPGAVRRKGGKAAEMYTTLLFDTKTDPLQQNPIVDLEIEEKMIAQMVLLMRENDAPVEQYERLGLEKYL